MITRMFSVLRYPVLRFITLAPSPRPFPLANPTQPHHAPPTSRAIFAREIDVGRRSSEVIFLFD
jgi:hypothetical protein